MLSNPHRTAILRVCLNEHGHTQAEISKMLGLKPSTISSYVSLLKSVGLLRVIIDGEKKRIKTITDKIQITILPIST